MGAGTAGALVANRLSANYSVLLLEAGGEPHPFQSIPAFATFLVNYPQNDWMYYTVPQQNGFFAQNHQVHDITVSNLIFYELSNKAI